MMPNELTPRRNKTKKSRVAETLARTSLLCGMGSGERIRRSSRLGNRRSASKTVMTPIATKEYITKNRCSAALSQ
jgi:hypothetical protein